MNIIQITPELAPVAKVGGLGDVVFGLSRELEIRGNSVEIIYRNMIVCDTTIFMGFRSRCMICGFPGMAAPFIVLSGLVLCMAASAFLSNRIQMRIFSIAGYFTAAMMT